MLLLRASSPAHRDRPDTEDAAFFYHQRRRIDKKNSWSENFHLHTILKGCSTILDNHLSFSGFTDNRDLVSALSPVRLPQSRSSPQDTAKTGSYLMFRQPSGCPVVLGRRGRRPARRVERSRCVFF